MAYPATLDSFTPLVDGVDTADAVNVNELQTAIVNTETELGTDVAGTATDLKTRLAHSINDAGMLEFDAATELTITTGAITVTQNYHRVDTEGDAASDDLDTVAGFSAGFWLVLRAENAGRTVVVKHGTGNISCAGGADISLNEVYENAIMIYDSATSMWHAWKGAGGDAITGTGVANQVAVFSGTTTVAGDTALTWYSDGASYGDLYIGDQTADIDYTIVFNGETNQGTIKFLEDEAQFDLNQPLVIDTGTAAALTIGNGAAGVDYSVTVNGETNDGVFAWMEDEDYFLFSDGIHMNAQEAISFDSADTYIAANTDDPEDLVIAADQDILLEPDNQVHINAATANILKIGNGAAGVDYIITVDGETTDLTLTFQEDENNLAISSDITVKSYERHVQIEPSLTGNPADAAAAVAFFTAGGVQFATTGAKYVYCQWEVPDDWVGGEDAYIEIDWFPDSGAMSGTDTIKWDINYRSIAEGEAINNGTAVTVSVTDSADYLQYVTKHSRMTLDFDNANQPMVKQDHMYFQITRDTSVANDFAGTVTITAFEIIYNSNTMPASN